MVKHEEESLRWTSQFRISAEQHKTRLVGDQIILPATALVDLLQACEQVAVRPARGSTSQPADAETSTLRGATSQQPQLPHPLTFRIVNPETGRVVYAGVREFSAPDGCIDLSPHLRLALGLVTPTTDSTSPPIAGRSEAERITVHYHSVPKGEFVKLRPLKAGYDVKDWKALLERYLRDNFTTLTHGDELSVQSGTETLRFLVDGLMPDHEAVSLIDTDLEVDIEPLDEEQALETLRQLTAKSQAGRTDPNGNSADASLELSIEQEGQVVAGTYVDFVINTWDRGQDVEIMVSSLNADCEVDVLASLHGPRCRTKPREVNHLLADFSTNNSKRLVISCSEEDVRTAEAIWISIGRLHVDADSVSEARSAVPFRVLARHLATTLTNSSSDAGPSDERDGTENCSNCQQRIPKSTMFLHQNFCMRHNVFCPKCQQVFQRVSTSWANHWHCPLDSAFGNDVRGERKHGQLEHTSRSCDACGHVANSTTALSLHRSRSCPAKLILCQFCHLEVAQQGAGDPDFDSAEVIISGLTPHEYVDGARTTECHLCAKIVRLRDLTIHLKHHDLQRQKRPLPRACSNMNCGRLLDTMLPDGTTKPSNMMNDLRMCQSCFGSLYSSQYDLDGKALRRRVERRYLTQLMTGCGHSWCRNEFCKTGRRKIGLLAADETISSKTAGDLIKPVIANFSISGCDSYFCTDELGQQLKLLADQLSTQALGNGSYRSEWCKAALSVTNCEVNRASEWLKNFAPRLDGS